MKAHGCCRYEQGPLDAILAARRRHPFSAGGVTRIEVGMLAAGWGIVAEPLDEKRRPRSVVDSQFSMPFGAALAVAFGRAAAADHTAANLADPEIQRLMDLVECFHDPDLDASYPERWPASVRIHLEDGTVLEEQVDFPKGDPENPLDDEELVAKARSLVPGPAGDDAARVAARILSCTPAETGASQVLSEIRRVADAAVQAAGEEAM